MFYIWLLLQFIAEIKNVIYQKGHTVIIKGCQCKRLWKHEGYNTYGYVKSAKCGGRNSSADSIHILYNLSVFKRTIHKSSFWNYLYRQFDYYGDNPCILFSIGLADIWTRAFNTIISWGRNIRFLCLKFRLKIGSGKGGDTAVFV